VPTVMVTGPAVTQNSPISFRRSPYPSLVLILSTHGGMIRLSWPGWLGYQDSIPVNGITWLDIVYQFST